MSLDGSSRRAQSLDEWVAIKRQVRLDGYTPARVRGAIWRSLAELNDPSVIRWMCKELVEHNDRYSEISFALSLRSEESAVPLAETVVEVLAANKAVSWYVLGKACKLLLRTRVLLTPDLLPIISASLSASSKYARMPAMALVRMHGAINFVPLIEEIAICTRSKDEGDFSLDTLAEFALDSSWRVFSLFKDNDVQISDRKRPLAFMEEASLSTDSYRINEKVYYLSYRLRRGDVETLEELTTFVTSRYPNGGELIVLSQAVAELAKGALNSVLPYL
ncbi:MAG: hypothetical protein HYU30_10670 [Chloroflexi bacterium]|nr:hypothetical protein [Chloroflexota bacterium]